MRASTTFPVRRAGAAVAAAGLLALGLAGCRHGDGAAASDPPASRQAGPRVIEVGGQAGLEMDADALRLANLTTFTAGLADLRQTVQPTGEVAPTDAGTVQVTARLPGRITQALVSVGTRVRRGQLLASVDSTDLTQAEAAYQTALAHQQLAFNQLQQQRRLAKLGAIDEPALEDARRTLAAAQAAVHSDAEQIKVDTVALQNTQQLVAMGEITHKPVEDAQNAYAQSQAALQQARVNLHSTKSSYDRANTLFEGGIYSRQQLEDAETAYNNAQVAVSQGATQEGLAADELHRQESIYQKNLNGASSLQASQTKLQQDQHQYQSDVTALSLARRALARATAVRRSGIPVNQALQQAQDAYDEARVATQGAANALKLYGVGARQAFVQMAGGQAVIPVVSPIDGIVTARSMAVGQMTDASTPLARVVNLDRVYVDAQVFEGDLADVAAGDPVDIRVSAFPRRTFSGRVKVVGSEVSEDTRTVTVRTVVENPGWQLRPGMFATVLIGSSKAVKTLAVPADAVLQEGTRHIVFVEAAPRQFVEREVQVGETVGGRVAITRGLSTGDRVVVGGNVLLQSEMQRLQSEKRASA